MIWINPRTTDDRGQPSRVANHMDLRAVGISLSDLGLPPPGRMYYIRKGRRGDHHWSNIVGLLGALSSIMFVLYLINRYTFLSGQMAILFIVTFVAIFWWLTIAIWLKSFSQQFSRAIRSTGRCARCLYDLSRCPIEDDDCRICPECGSAWKVELAQPRLSL